MGQAYKCDRGDMSEEPLTITVHRGRHSEHVWLITKPDGTEIANGWVSELELLGVNLGKVFAETVAATVLAMIETYRLIQATAQAQE